MAVVWMVGVLIVVLIVVVFMVCWWCIGGVHGVLVVFRGPRLLLFVSQHAAPTAQTSQLVLANSPHRDMKTAKTTVNSLSNT